MEIKVISFNIRGDNDPNGHSVEERAPRLKSLIDSCNVDIMGFQEYMPLWQPYLERDYGEDFEIFVKGRGETDPEATPILWRKSKFTCLEKGYFWFSDTPDVPSGGWDKACSCLRICNFVKLKEKETGKEFVYFNTHYGFGEEFQIKAAAAINGRIPDGIPAIVTGDFNLTHTSKGYGELMKYFKDVNMETVKNMHNTYHGYKGTTEQAPIDFCFINSLAKPVDYVLLNKDFNGKYASDHHGIFATVQL